MKKGLKRAGTLLLAVMLICALLAMPAGAVSNTFTEGEYISWIVASEGAEVLDCWADTALLPPGTSLTATYDTIVLSGTPTTPGTYEFFVDAYYSTPDGDINRGYSVTVTVAAAPAPTPVQAASGTNAATPPPAAPEPTSVPDIVITKHPSGETVTAGSSTYFVARADNASQILWLVQAPDGSYYGAADAPNYTSSSLYVSGLGTDTLSLSNIPMSMDGWSVLCQFIGLDGTGSATTNAAKITVVEAPTATPKPTEAPATPAPEPTAEPEPAEGPAPAVESRPTEEPAPTEKPAAAAKPEDGGGDKGGKNSGGGDKGGKGTSGTPEGKKSGGMDFRLIAVIALGVIIVALGTVLVLMQAKKKPTAPKQKASAASSPYRFRCDKCGWEPADPNSIPRFCPNCGDVFDEKDVTVAGRGKS